MNLEIILTPYMMFGLIVVKYIRLPTSLLNSVASTIDPSSSLLNFKPVITGVGAVLQLDILNLFRNALAYFNYDMKIPLSDCSTLIPRKNFMSPKSLISNSLSMTILNYFMPKSRVNIKLFAYMQAINMLTFSFTLGYNIGSLSLM